MILQRRGPVACYINCETFKGLSGNVALHLIFHSKCSLNFKHEIVVFGGFFVSLYLHAITRVTTHTFGGENT